MSIPLTIIVPNRNRFDVNSNPTKFWVRSIEAQENKNFKVTIVDGGSDNYKEIKDFFASHNISCVQYAISSKWNKCILNNFAVRNADTPYIMTSDADMFFAPKLTDRIIALLSHDAWIQSRTMYWKEKVAGWIYDGKLDPFTNIDSCKQGRIKKRTTAGGCQCGHIDIWNKVRGYDERYVGWGSEDVDLLERVKKAGFGVKWIGESLEDIMLFHQPHGKPNYEQDMKDQYSNLNYYYNIASFEANPNGWGGKK